MNWKSQTELDDNKTNKPLETNTGILGHIIIRVQVSWHWWTSLITREQGVW